MYQYIFTASSVFWGFALNVLFLKFYEVWDWKSNLYTQLVFRGTDKCGLGPSRSCGEMKHKNLFSSVFKEIMNE